MSATTWLIIAIVGFSLSGIALIATVFMFIKMNIPAIIGDLTGKTVARQIQAMRDANSSSGNKLHRSSSVNSNRGVLTDKVDDVISDSSARAIAHDSKRLDKLQSDQSYRLYSDNADRRNGLNSKGRTTESFSTNVEEADFYEDRFTDVLEKNGTNNILDEIKATDVLSESVKTRLLYESRRTQLLADDVGTKSSTFEISNNERAETTVLAESEVIARESVTPVAFKVTKSVVVIHTDEVVQ